MFLGLKERECIFILDFTFFVIYFFKTFYVSFVEIYCFLSFIYLLLKIFEAFFILRNLSSEVCFVVFKHNVSRFKEREENVKADIFRAYIALLKHTKLVADPKSDDQGLLKLLQSQVPRLVRSINRQLREKSLKTRQCCFAVLSELLRVSPGSLSDHMSLIIPGVQHAMTDKLSNSNMKIDTLSFLGVALSTHQPHVSYSIPFFAFFLFWNFFAQK